MSINILQYLEETVRRVPQKIAFGDENTTLSFEAFADKAKRVGTYLTRRGAYHEPVIVYMKRSPDFLAAFFGVVYSGCFYIPIDEEMPAGRIELILQNVKAKYMICDLQTKKAAERFRFQGTVVLYEDCLLQEADFQLLLQIRKRVLDVDPVCVFFTSGSTGIPKGVVVCHRGIIDYIEHLSVVLDFNESSVFANQTPLYWDASMKEIYATLKYGATTWLVPKELFMFPVQLMEYLNQHKVNTICWVVSALTIVSAFGTFDIIRPEYIRTVAFCGEVFPVKQYNIWKKILPNVNFYNLYGPTEGTGVCTYYHADRLFDESEVIPIGKPFTNTEILLLNAEGCEVDNGDIGEICIRGSGVTLGYYHMLGKSAEVFSQNPQNPYYFDRIYHTGDMAYRDDNQDLIFVARQDHQIKHMGHRIELGEIEADVLMVEGVQICCCIYVKEKNKIVLFYVGGIEKGALTRELRERLPSYMLPNSIMQVERMPLTPSGKMDRLQMQELYFKEKPQRNRMFTDTTEGRKA